MTKENFLFGIIGLLAGFMIGFFFANSVNKSAAVPSQPEGTQTSAGLPSGHPSISGGSGGGAIPEVQEAIDRAKQNPNDFDAQVKAAELYYQIQRFDGAIEFLKKANELRPDDYEALVNLGNANFDAGRYSEAEKIYTKALAKKPDDLNVRSDLGLTFIFRTDPNLDRAVQEFNRVLEANPNHIQALQYLTIAYTRKSDIESANRTLARLEQVDASNAAIPRLRDEIEKAAPK